MHYEAPSEDGDNMFAGMLVTTFKVHSVATQKTSSLLWEPQVSSLCKWYVWYSCAHFCGTHTARALFWSLSVYNFMHMKNFKTYVIFILNRNINRLQYSPERWVTTTRSTANIVIAATWDIPKNWRRNAKNWQHSLLNSHLWNKRMYSSMDEENQLGQGWQNFLWLCAKP